MSTTTHAALDLYERSGPASLSRSFLTTLRLAWEGIGDGFAAARRYQELTRRGVPHETAASKVFFEHYSGR